MEGPRSEPIRYYFDFSSPYGYLASHRIAELAARHGRSVDWHPILLGVIFRITGQTPLVDQPMCGNYFRRDMARLAREWHVPWTFPEVFSLNSIPASRTFYWLKDDAPDQAEAFARQIYKAYWGEGRDMGKPELVAAEAEAVGLDGGAILAALQEPAVKERLKQEVGAAVGHGMFGSPTFLVESEPFFGCDKMEQLDRWLSRGGW